MANRDLTRRVKHLSHDVFPYSKEVVRADIELATTLIQYLDSKHELFTEVYTYHIARYFRSMYISRIKFCGWQFTTENDAK